MFRWLIYFFSWCFLLSCDKKQNDSISEGVNKVEISTGGLTRSLLVHIPDSLGDGPHPVLFAFHGGQGTNTIYPSALENIISQNHWIGVYPQGVNGFWNSDIGTSSANDTGFVRAIVEWLHERFSIDDNRIYALGFSNGAIFCHKMARESNIFAAIAPVNGSWLAGQTIPSGAPAISVLQVTSLNDEIVPFNGGSPQGLSFQSVFAMMDGYAVHNGCPLAIKDTLENTPNVSVFHYLPCAVDLNLIIYRLNQKSHFLDDATWSTVYSEIGSFLQGKTK